jgi:hypothetical protein
MQLLHTHTIIKTTNRARNKHTTQTGAREHTPLSVVCHLTTESATVLGRTLAGERLKGGACTCVALGG